MVYLGPRRLKKKVNITRAGFIILPFQTARFFIVSFKNVASSSYQKPALIGFDSREPKKTHHHYFIGRYVYTVFFFNFMCKNGLNFPPWIIAYRLLLTMGTRVYLYAKMSQSTYVYKIIFPISRFVHIIFIPKYLTILDTHIACCHVLMVPRYWMCGTKLAFLNNYKPMPYSYSALQLTYYSNCTKYPNHNSHMLSCVHLSRLSKFDKLYIMDYIKNYEYLIQHRLDNVFIIDGLIQC